MMSWRFSYYRSLIIDLSRNTDERDATNALKQFLNDQFVKFFFLIGQPNALKHCETLTAA